MAFVLAKLVAVVSYDYFYELGYLIYIALGVAGIVVFVAGLRFSAKKSDEANNKVSSEEEKLVNRNKELETENRIFRVKQGKLKKEVSVYDDLFPLRYRKSEYMDKICNMFKNGKAADFEEAVILLKRSK